MIIDLRIDGLIAGSIGYGHTYEGFLTPGRHVLLVRATPFNWVTWTQLIVDVESGQTYNFTVASDHSGYVVLKGG